MIIKTDTKTYPIIVQSGLMNELTHHLNYICQDVSKILVVTDEIVYGLHGHYLKQLEEIAETFVQVIPSGEKSKSFTEFYSIQTKALSHSLDRNSCIIAFGGGMIGDLAGFVAATYMRGIRYIQVPTTLLAHDSAVGGKVAINHPLGKNMIGAFYQPEAVFYDIELLKTLPEQELRSGFAEVLKHGFIAKEPFIYDLLKHVETLKKLQGDLLEDVIKKGIVVKATIVETDEKETNTRAFLNFGHTLGQSLENLYGYGTMTHGDAVALGMLFALHVSEELYGVNFQLSMWISRFKKYGFPTEITGETTEIIEKMKLDKKTQSGMIRFVTLKNIGQPMVEKITDTWMYDALESFKRIKK